MEFLENVPLAPLTTLGVGGPARWFCQVESEHQLSVAVTWAKERQLPLFILGGGSNLVVSDSGWPGLVLQMAIRHLRMEEDRDRVHFEAGAGENWDALVSRSIEMNCAGIECLSGIPGTVGGTPIQNVGAYGQDVSETILDLRALDLTTGEFVDLSNSDCGFSYRSSRFNSTDRERFIVTQVRFSLLRDGEAKIEYADLKNYFAERTAVPSLAETRQAVLAIRHRKAMLIVEGDEDCHSAGSFFKNPVVDRNTFESISRVAEERGLKVPHYPAGPNFKVAAAWLVEQSGIHKGFTLGRVGISRRHSLAIVNRGGATTADVIALKDIVRSRVQDSFGVELHAEPVFVGF